MTASNPGLSRRDIQTLHDLRRLPFTTKAELALDQENSPPYGTNLTFPLKSYTRLHQTSGTQGVPLRWLDTQESWDWWARCWGHVFTGVGVGKGDRIFYAFSFGPFIGFWAAYEGGRKVGALTVPGGPNGMHRGEKSHGFEAGLRHIF